MKLGKISGHKHMLGRILVPVTAPFFIVGWTLAMKAWFPWDANQNEKDVWMGAVFMPIGAIALGIFVFFAARAAALAWVSFVRKGVELDRETRTQFKLRESRKAEAGGLSEVESSEAGAMSLATKEPHNG